MKPRPVAEIVEELLSAIAAARAQDNGSRETAVETTGAYLGGMRASEEAFGAAVMLLDAAGVSRDEQVSVLRNVQASLPLTFFVETSTGN